MPHQLAAILDVLSGLFIGVAIGGAVCLGYVVYALLGYALLGVLVGALFFCVFLFFGVAAKALSMLLKHLL